MKLIFCPECAEIVTLKKNNRSCGCGKSGGHYVDDSQAEIRGLAVPIGIDNRSFDAALRRQRFADRDGDNPDGSIFTAWIIPADTETIKKIGQ